MTTNNEDPKPADNMEALKQQASACCGSDCGCHGPTKAPNKIRWVLGTIVLVAAGAMVVKAVLKNNSVSPEKTTTGYAAVSPTAQAPAPVARAPADMNEPSATASVKVIKTIGTLSELNTVAADTTAVFMLLPGKNETADKSPLAQVQGAVRTIETQSGTKVGIFTLKTDSPEYEQIAKQMALPGVLAMVKGRGMVPVSDEITETKLVQAYVAASSAGGCGAGGCGPTGCK
jgi:hypothetical protein